MAESTTTTAAKPTSVILHHLENSRSQRILWLLEELEIPYEVKLYKRNPDRRAPASLLAIHPLGKSPVLTDGEGDSKLVLAESAAIIEYLIECYGKEKFGFANKEGDAWVQNLYWTHYAEGSLQPHITSRFIFRLVPSHAPFFIRPIAKALFGKVESMLTSPELEKHGKMIEDHLTKVSSNGGSGWFSGLDHPTSADFILSFTLEVYVERAPEYAGPNTKAWVKKIQAREAYKRVLEKGGDYAFVFKD